MRSIFCLSKPNTGSFSSKLTLSLAIASLVSVGIGLADINTAAQAIELADNATWELAEDRDDRDEQFSDLPRSAYRAILQDATRRTGIASNRLRVIQVRPRTFSNFCKFSFGEACNRQYNPIEGWEVTVRADRQFLLYHVDRSGSRIIPDPAIAASNDTLPNQVRNAVLRDASRRSGLPINALRITQATSKTFGNPCEFNFGEFCTREYNPIEGWEVVVEGQRQSWTYHVNRSASQVVLDPQFGNSNASLPSAVRNAVLRDATRWTQLSTRDIEIKFAERKTWDNSCVFSFGSVCPMIYQPVTGWQVQVSAGLLNWVYRTNQNGTELVMDQRGAMPPQIADAIVQDARRRWNVSARRGLLRFLTVKEHTRRVCTFLINCRNESVWLAIVSNGRQQWGYQVDAQGRRIQPVPVAQVQQAVNQTTREDRILDRILD
jgi:uncharacterized protein YcnI